MTTFDMFQMAMKELDERWKNERLNVQSSQVSKRAFASDERDFEEFNDEQRRSPSTSPPNNKKMKQFSLHAPVVNHAASNETTSPSSVVSSSSLSSSSPSSVSKATRARHEFWAMMTFCINNNIPMFGYLASDEKEIKNKHTVMFLKSSRHGENGKIVRLEVRMNPALAGLVMAELDKNSVFKMLDLGRGLYAFEIDTKQSDVILHVMSQGVRDPAGTITGPTNCFCTKFNGSKHNRKPKGNVLVVPMPDPALHVTRYIQRRDVFFNTGSVCDMYVNFRGAENMFTCMLAGYNAASNKFTFEFDEATSKIFEEQINQSMDNSFDTLMIQPFFNNPSVHIEIQSDSALLRDTRAHALFYLCMSNKDGNKIKAAVHVFVKEPQSRNEHDKLLLIKNIPQIKPYIPI